MQSVLGNSLWVQDPQTCFFFVDSIVHWQHLLRCELAHTPSTHQITTIPPSHDPHTYIADVEAAEKCFHVPATPSEVLSTSDDIARAWRCFSVSSTSGKYLYTTPLCFATSLINQEAQEWPKCTKVQRPKYEILRLMATHHSGAAWDR